MTRRSPVLLAALAAILVPTLPAQDLLGAAWDGTIVRIDSYTGHVSPLGMGLAGQNGLARSSTGVFWSTRRTSSGTYSFTTIDPTTGTATVAFTGQDIRALSIGPNGNLFGTRQFTNGSTLVRVDTIGGVAYLIGATGFQGIQGLAMHQGVLYGWDVFAGLVIVDPNTGAATDPFPSVGGPAYQQSLCSHPDGRLLLGGGNSNGADQLFVVDPATGIATWIADLLGVTDLRGIEPIGGYAQPLGQGCNGASGPVVLSVTGMLNGGGSLLSTSGNHAPAAFGALVFGFSTASYQGHPLPYLLDPQYGTSQCWLLTSMDALMFDFTSAAAPATLQIGFGLPVWLTGQQFHLQHVCFEPVPGSMSWSGARTIHVQ
jgi:hypothetical protein